MQSYEREASTVQFESGHDLQLLRLGAMPEQGIDHDVSCKVNLGGINTFTLEVFVGVAAGREEKVGKSVGHKAIDFFRHRPVEAAQPGLDMCDGNPKFCCDDGACH